MCGPGPHLVMPSGQLLPERGMPSYKSHVTTPQMNRGITRNQPGHQLSLQHTLSPKTHNTVHFSACSFQPLPMTPACQPPHPSVLSQSTGFECSASCIELALVICFTYGNVHVSTLFSQIIPPLLSPTEPQSLFTSVSLLLSPIYIKSSLPSF